MKTKQKDELYCGVNYKNIREAKPILNEENFIHFLTFMGERFRIHVKKDILKEPYPWTKNVVLKDYKFTNVFREDDRQTRYLIKHVVKNPELSLEDKIVNCFMFRAWNNYDTFRDFGLPKSAQELYDPSLKENIRLVYQKLHRDNPGRMWWSSAYNQGGTKHAWKFPEGDGYQRAYREADAKKYADWEKDIPLRPFHVAVWLDKQNIAEKLLKAENQLECFETIKSVRGFSDFLAYQVFVDLSYIKEFPFSENEFTVAGPGCKKGIDLVFEDKDGLTYEECLFWLRDYLKTQTFIELRREFREYHRDINVMSLENCMCEISKYIRTVTGTGRPRCHYKPRKED